MIALMAIVVLLVLTLFVAAVVNAILDGEERRIKSKQLARRKYAKKDSQEK